MKFKRRSRFISKKVACCMLAGVVTASCLTAIPVGAEKVYTNNRLTCSTYDLNRDGNVNVFDMISMRRFFMGTSSISETDLANGEKIDRIKFAVETYLTQSREYSARVKNIEIYSTTRDGRIQDNSIAVVEFDKELDEQAIEELIKGVDFDSTDIKELAGKCKYLRIAILDESVSAAVPSTESAYDTKTALVYPYSSDINMSDNHKAVLDKLDYTIREDIADRSSDWYARITDINYTLPSIDGSETPDFDNMIGTITFDTTFDERALQLLSTAYDESYLDLYAGKSNQLRVYLKSGSTLVAIPVLDGSYSQTSTIYEESDVALRTIRTKAISLLTYVSEEWYARVNSIDIDFDKETNTAEILVTFCRPLNEDIVKRFALLSGIDDIDAEVDYALSNNINQVKMIYNDGSINAVVPYSAT